MKTISRLALLALTLAAACDAPRPASPSAYASPPTRSATYVDHADGEEGTEAQLQRFRADLPESPAALASGAESRDSLIQRYVRALEQRDTLTLEALSLTRTEFAYLYYPSSKMSSPPYELPAALMWARLQASNRKGALRALDAYGGRLLGFTGYHCPEPSTEGENRIWAGCLLRTTGGELRLFGSILERGGRYAFISLANDL
jgi:hypothetical protein